MAQFVKLDPELLAVQDSAVALRHLAAGMAIEICTLAMSGWYLTTSRWRKSLAAPSGKPTPRNRSQARSPLK